MGRRLSIAVVGTAGLPPRYGGFETLANYLTEKLGGRLEFTVFCPKTPKAQRLKTYNGARLIYLPFHANGPQSIVYDMVSILYSVLRFNRILILGSGGALILPFLFPFRRKFVLNFGGLEWKRDKFGPLARKYLKLTEFLGVIFSRKIIADNQYFVDYIDSEYGRHSLLIEYGGDHCISTAISELYSDRYPFLNESYYLSVSRAQEDNNIHVLLEAFSRLPEYKVVIISNWSTSDYGRTLKNKYSGITNIVLLDAIYDLAVLNCIRANAQSYIHSHSFCGTAPSLVEIMNMGKPVIAFNAPTNLETTERKAVYFETVEDLRKVLMSVSEEDLVENGRTMLEIAKRRYSWDIIAKKYYEALT